MRRLWSQILQTGSTDVFGLLVQVVVLVVTARVLGPTGRGIYVAANSWVLLLGTFGALSLGQVILRQAAEEADQSWQLENLGAVLVILAILTILIWASVLIGYRVTQGELFNHLTPLVLIFAFLVLPFILGLENGRYILLALNDLKSFNLAQVLGNLVGLVAVPLFVIVFRWGIPGALLGFFVWKSSVVFLIFRAIFQKIPPLTVDFKHFGDLLKGSAKLHFNAIGTVLLTQATIVMVNHYGLPEETGFYQLATQIIMVVQIAPVAVSMVAYTLVSQKGPDEAWGEQRQLLLQALVLVSVVAVLGYLLAPIGIVLAAGNDFLPAVPVFRILLLSLIGMTFSLLLASQWIGRGLFVQASLFTLGVGILNVFANYLIIPRYGIVGAAWVTVGIYCLVILVNGTLAVIVERRWRAGQIPQSKDPVPVEQHSGYG